MNCSWLYGCIRELGKVAALVFAGITPVWAEPVTIVALGDSLTQGYGLIEQDGFVPRMRGWLAAHDADVRLINAGVSGDTTAGGLARADWSLTDDVDAMILTLGGNDMLRGIDPAVSRANLSGILKIAADKNVQVLVVGMKAAGNYGPDYKAAFDRMYSDLATQYGALLAENFFAGLGNDTPAALGDLMQMDGIHPNGKGVKLIVAALGPEVLDLIARVEN